MEPLNIPTSVRHRLWHVKMAEVLKPLAKKECVCSIDPTAVNYFMYFNGVVRGRCVYCDKAYQKTA